MNFGEMQTRVYNLLGVANATNSGVTAAEVMDTLNAVAGEIAASIEDLLTYCEYQCTAYAGTGVEADVVAAQRYSVPEHYLTAKQLLLARSITLPYNQWDRLIYCNLEEFERVSYGSSLRTGIPKYYMVQRWATRTTNIPPIPGDIWLCPLPDAAYYMRFFYYQRPTELANDSSEDTYTFELPSHWHMIVCLRAAEILAVKIKDYELSRLLEGKYWAALSEAKAQAMRPQRDRATAMVRDVMGYTDIVE